MKKNKPEPAGFFGLREVAPYHPRAPCTEIPCMLRFGYVFIRLSGFRRLIVSLKTLEP